MTFTWKPFAVALAIALAGGGLYSSAACADDTQDEIKVLKDQVNVIMKRIDDLSNQEKETSKKQQKIEETVKSAPPAVGSSEPKFEKFLKGFYGTLDVSGDAVTKGMKGMVANQFLLSDPTNAKSPIVKSVHAPPVGRVGWMAELSTNKSGIGYRGDHDIAGSGVKYLYQIESALVITASPGVNTGFTAQSNVVRGALGFGDSFVGLAKNDWGQIKFGTVYSPYKKSTDRMNPFSGMLGDYAVVMGNSGGDNRVEFGTRLDHSMWYESPKYQNGVSYAVLISPGQNRTFDNVVQSAGSPDCNGGNMPGSGNLPLNCDDGAFDNAFSAALNYENDRFYATAAYEFHHHVNRNSDGIGSNSVAYQQFAANNPSLISGGAQVFGNPSSLTIGQGAYLTDIGNESAAKVGMQYAFPMGLTVSGMFEYLKRYIPAYLYFQNERSRTGTWLAATQKLGEKDSVSAGWAHAGPTPGDPGGQHNFSPFTGTNSADMYTLAYKHQLDKQLFWYADYALTINHGNAHYDLGAGGRGLTTDCHDGTNTVFVDATGAGPTTWGGCRVQGVSVGMNYKF